LATDGGISDDGDGVDDLPALSAAASVTSVFLSSLSLSSVDLAATLLDLWCAYFRQCRELCRVYLLSAIGAAAVGLAAAVLGAATVGDGPAKHIQSPAASINAERPLPLIFIWQSPHYASPVAK
jgi:hypothetical protein